MAANRAAPFPVALARGPVNAAWPRAGRDAHRGPSSRTGAAR